MKKGATVSLTLVLFVVFLDWMGVGLVYPMFSTMLFSSEGPLLDPNSTATVRGVYLGLLLSAMSAAQFFSGPVLGAFSDQLGRKPLFILTLILGVVGYALSTVGVLAQSIGLLIAARLLTGIAAGNAAVVNATIADLSTPDTKAKYFGYMSMSVGIGFTVGPILGGKLSQINYAVPFIVAGIATLFNLILIFFLFRETHTVRKNAHIRIGEGLHNLKKAFQIPGLQAIFITILLFCFGWSFFFEFIPVAWIADYNFNSSQIGFFFAYGAGFYALSAGLLIRPIVKRFSSGLVFFASLIALSITFFALLCHPHEFWVWIYLPIVNFFSALIFPTSTTMVSDWADENTQGETLGILASVQAAAFALSPLAAGSVLGNNPHMPMALGGIAMALAALILGVLARKELFK